MSSECMSIKLCFVNGVYVSTLVLKNSPFSVTRNSEHFNQIDLPIERCHRDARVKWLFTLLFAFDAFENEICRFCTSFCHLLTRKENSSIYSKNYHGKIPAEQLLIARYFKHLKRCYYLFNHSARTKFGCYRHLLVVKYSRLWRSISNQRLNWHYTI